MLKTLTLAGLALATSLQSAFADFWIEWPNGSATYVTDDEFFFALLFGVAVVIVGGIAASSSSSSTASSSELSATELAQQYDDEAAQYRAMSRKLDAETDLAESVIKAKRTRAELDDIEDMFKDGKRRR
jgi:hypothetical protein